MSETEGNDRPFIPPPEGGGDWLSFYPCPYLAREDVAPWFNRFAGATCSDVKAMLRRDWEDIQHPTLRAFTEALLRFSPCGLLHSVHAFYGNRAWLVLSRWQPSSELASAIERREDLEGMRYLAAPCILPSGTTVDPGNLVHSFFTRFGGMSFAPPFMSDFFYPYPTLPAEGEPGEFDRMVDRTEDSQWKEARTFFVRDTGDELLLNSEGRCGWWLHASRKIVSAGSFQDVLLQLSRVSL